MVDCPTTSASSTLVGAVIDLWSGVVQPDRGREPVSLWVLRRPPPRQLLRPRGAWPVSQMGEGPRATPLRLNFQLIHLIAPLFQHPNAAHPNGFLQITFSNAWRPSSLHNLQRLCQGVGKVGRFLDACRVGAAGLRGEFEVRRRTQIRARKVSRPGRFTVRVQAAGGNQACVPSLVVVDHSEKWNAIFLRREVTGGRRTEHVRTVAFGGYNGRVWHA